MDDYGYEYCGIEDFPDGCWEVAETDHTWDVSPEESIAAVYGAHGPDERLDGDDDEFPPSAVGRRGTFAIFPKKLVASGGTLHPERFFGRSTELFSFYKILVQTCYFEIFSFLLWKKSKKSKKIENYRPPDEMNCSGR